jgi:hypothetical protein
MRLILYFLLLFSQAIFAQSQTSAVSGVEINPAIKFEVEKHIQSAPESQMAIEKMQIFSTPLICSLYKDDKLEFESSDFSKKMVFKSFITFDGNKTSISGIFGIFGGEGFVINIENNKAVLSHLISADDFATLAYTSTSEFLLRLEVPCTNTKIVLSALPKKGSDELIYGYVEFTGTDFYFGFSEDGIEATPRQKQRSNFKIYFKSGEITL